MPYQMDKRNRTNILKEVESGEALNFIQIRKNRVLRSIHLSNVHLSLQCISQVLPNRSKLLAVSAPLSNQPTRQQSYRSVELDKPTARRGPTVHLSEQFEVVIVQINHLWKSVHYRFPTRTRQAKNKSESKDSTGLYPTWSRTISSCCLSSLNLPRVVNSGDRWDP